MISLHFIGIDVAKAKLDVAYLKDAQALKFKNKVFTNNAKGFAELKEWLIKNTGADLADIHVTLEPTGVYHENVAHFLHDLGIKVNLINPARLPAFANFLGTTHKNDKGDSKLLARIGAQQPNELWTPAPLSIRHLKAKVTRLDALKADLQREANRLEQAQASDYPLDVVNSITSVMQFLEQAIKDLHQDINDDIDKDDTLKQDKTLLETIPGIGDVLSTKMMVLYRSKSFNKASQMAAFLGLVPKERSSGTMKGKVMLSKRGSSELRAALYLPAIVAKQHNPDIKAHYDRLLARGKSKMQAIGAAMRRLVHICFGVLKHQSRYEAKSVNLAI